VSLEHIANSIPELIVKSTRLVRIGQETERARLLPHFVAIFRAYELAVADSKALPSPLMMAIESARQEIGKLSASSALRSA
jgi:hypothetical protein